MERFVASHEGRAEHLPLDAAMDRPRTRATTAGGERSHPLCRSATGDAIRGLRLVERANAVGTLRTDQTGAAAGQGGSDVGSSALPYSALTRVRHPDA